MDNWLPAELADARQRFTRAKVLVAGDVMLDRYWFGDVQRISPEAPVPVVRVSTTEERPGGAANVALNVHSLGGQTQLVGIVGNDEPGARLDALLRELKIAAHLLVDEQVPTIVKLRVIGRQQQMLRVDFEQTPGDAVAAQMQPAVDAGLQAGATLVISDYNKGALADPASLISMARGRNCPVIVDPKGEDFSRYAGASVLTPNRGELRQCVGSWRDEQDLTERAMRVRDELQLDYLLVTRSEEGMSLYGQQGVTHFPAQAREVFDVSGAGDTVVAVLAAGVAGGLAVQKAVQLANKAGAIVVAKLGTAAVSPDELFIS